MRRAVLSLTFLLATVFASTLFGQPPEVELLVRFKSPDVSIQAVDNQQMAAIQQAATPQDAQELRQSFIARLRQRFEKDWQSNEDGGFFSVLQSATDGAELQAKEDDPHSFTNGQLDVFAAPASQSCIVSTRKDIAEEIRQELADNSECEVQVFPVLQDVPIDDKYLQPQAVIQSATGSWALDRIKASGITQYDGSGVKVGIIDSGIQRNHVAFRNTKIEAGENFTAAGTQVSDDIGHGTTVAGIVAGTPTGVAPGATIVPFQIFASGRNSFLTPMRAFEKALAQGVDVINMSIGMPYEGSAGANSVLLRSWNDAFAKAKQANVIAVSAAGNFPDSAISNAFAQLGLGADLGDVLLPGASRHTIAVAATTKATTNPPANFSRPIANRAFNTVRPVDLAAPGENVPSAQLNGTYGNFNGTSFATPYVTGAVALLRQKDPGITQDEAVEALKKSAASLGSSNRLGAGLLDVAKLLDVHVNENNNGNSNNNGNGNNNSNGNNNRGNSGGATINMARLEQNIVALTTLRDYWAGRVGRKVAATDTDLDNMSNADLREEIKRLQEKLKEHSGGQDSIPFNPDDLDEDVPAPPEPGDDSPTDGAPEAASDVTLAELAEKIAEYAKINTEAATRLEDGLNAITSHLLFSFQPTHTVKADSTLTLNDGTEVPIKKGSQVRLLYRKPEDDKLAYVEVVLTATVDDSGETRQSLHVGKLKKEVLKPI